MKIVFASYVYTAQYIRSDDWLQRINIYAGILEALALKHTIISIEQIDYVGEYQHNGVQYMFKKLSKIERRLPFKLHQYIKSLQPDVVFIHGLHFSWQIIQLRLQLGNKVKIIAQHHAEQPYTGLKKLVQQLADRHIDAYLFASRDMGMDWVNRGNLASPEKIHEVMEVSSVFGPMPKQVAIAKTGITAQSVFLWVGRLNDNKDPLTVIKAFLQFARVNKTASMYMIYQTEELLPQIISLISQYPKQQDSVVLVGKVAHAELGYWYNSANFIISGSHYEGSSTVVCEAMSCGCIPIVTDILSFRMMTDNGQFGLLYPAGNQGALLTKLLQSMEINTDEQRKTILKYYNENLSFAAIAGKIEAVATSL